VHRSKQLDRLVSLSFLTTLSIERAINFHQLSLSRQQKEAVMNEHILHESSTSVRIAGFHPFEKCDGE
jgi:hypothetical protein